jgi:hypothetical protein
VTPEPQFTAVDLAGREAASEHDDTFPERVPDPNTFDRNNGVR